jgi:lipopolysaccharide/colanic/teichoic acid biosynthesis glycosyltransferase
MGRLSNLLLAVAALSLLLPVVLIIAAGVRIMVGSPVIFIQNRPGLHGKVFTLYKFRTMRDETDETGNQKADADRLTRFGRWLRRTSLDELPELWNVIRGDMNLVGPRPLLTEYLPLYTDFQKRRHEVLPGLTGWVQINGRNDLSWDEKFELDIWYVDNRSAWLDLKILALTVWTVLRAKGVSQRGHATAEKFTGSK